MDYSPWSSKNLIDRNRLKKFMQVGIDVKCMSHQFWWVWSLSVSEILLPSKTANFPLWSSKNLRSESAQKIHANRD